jgi:type II secretion system protein H
MVGKSITKKCVNGNLLSGNQNVVRREAGVTLVELLVVIAIIGIMTAVALTSMRPGPSKVKSAAMNFRSRMMLAKSEAIKRNEDVEITFDPGNGTYVARDSDAELVFSAGLESDISMATNNTSVTFKPLGTASTSSFWIQGYGQSYKISINSVGKIIIE